MSRKENIVVNEKKSHKEWRKEAKKFRRKKVRSKAAKLREENEKSLEEILLKDPAHLTQLAEQRALELQKEEEFEKQKIEAEQKYLDCEKVAQIEFERKQQLITEREEKVEIEKIKKREVLEKHRKIVDEKDKRRELIFNQIHEYTHGEGELPEELNIPIATNPDQELCQFFKKTGCCRFSDKCLRNHVRPCVSKTILIPHFFELNYPDQKGRKSNNVEFISSQTYQNFVEFYEDVLPEFERIGEVVQFRVCYNYLPHLKGNVFVEFRDQRKAVEAFQLMYGRYYGGKKIYSEFVAVESWKAAACGLALSNKCHIGKACNFLHVFRNPRNRFPIVDDRMSSIRKNTSIRSTRTNGWHDDPGSIRTRNWRWSETPEPERCSKRRNNSGSKVSNSRDVRNSRSRRSSSRTKRRSRSKEYSSRRNRSRERRRNNHKRDSSKSESRHRSYSNSSTSKSDYNSGRSSRKRNRSKDKRRRSRSKSKSDARANKRRKLSRSSEKRYKSKRKSRSKSKTKYRSKSRSTSKQNSYRKSKRSRF